MMSVLTSPEFWSALAGAVVGGAITFVCQLYALREARTQRDADQRTKRQAQANALFFKLMKIHSNLHGVHSHFWECLEEGRKELPDAEPWQVVRPLANPPESIHLPADEMGMLLGMKNDPLFHAVMDVEAMHNALLAAVHAYNTERITLGDRLARTQEVHSEVGDRVSGVLSNKERNALRPAMIGVNSLADSILAQAKSALTLSREAVQGAQSMFRERLKLPFTVEIKPDADLA
jgi:hypothetical protein